VSERTGVYHGATMLKLAGILSGLVALLHLAVIFVGASAYRYFGAGEEMAQLAQRGSPLPALITGAIVAVFAVWALYGFSGAGWIRRLPLLRIGLLTIGVVYTLRGLALGPELVWHFSGGAALVPARLPVFSAVSLLTGVLYLWGTLRAWTRLSRRPAS